MELNKLNVAYTLTDKTDFGWETAGNINQDTLGSINIGINTLLHDAEANTATNVGSLFYQESADGKVSLTYSFVKEYHDQFVEYCEALVKDVLSQIEF